MTSTDMWWLFWTFCFAVAGGGFFLIALVVLVRGVGDLRRMVRALTSRPSSS
jgi:hypothetical protein